MIALDLDGTLLNRDKQISAKNLAALQLAKNQGLKLVFDTGRPLVSTQAYIKQCQLTEEDDYAILLNGGLICRGTGEKLYEKHLSYSEVRTILDLAHDLDLPADIILDEKSYTVEFGRASRVSYVNNTLTFMSVSADELPKNAAYNKLILSADATILDERLPELIKQLGAKFEICKTRDILLEIMPKGVTKASGLSLLCERLTIKPSEVLAMGDEDNDIPMLKWAGLGIAPANANEKARAAADKVSEKSNDENVVAAVIEEYVLR